MNFSFWARRRPAAAQAPQPAPTTPESAAPEPTTTRRPSRAAPIDLTCRALELANDDWTEQQAADELARLADHDRGRLLAAYEQLVAGLVERNEPDVRGVRASRVLSRATRLSAAWPPAVHQEPRHLRRG